MAGEGACCWLSPGPGLWEEQGAVQGWEEDGNVSAVWPSSSRSRWEMLPPSHSAKERGGSGEERAGLLVQEPLAGQAGRQAPRTPSRPRPCTWAV